MYGPRRDPMTVVVMCDGQVNAPRGVRGGGDGPPAQTYKVLANSTAEKLPGVIECRLARVNASAASTPAAVATATVGARPGAPLKTCSNAGKHRAHGRLRRGFTGSLADETLAIDAAAAADRRRTLATRL